MYAFTEHLKEVFARFGPISVRRMFGGHGLYREGLMFGLVFKEQVYLKADAQNQAEFEQLGLGAFVYEAKGKAVKLSYFQAPDALMDEPELAAVWAWRSFDAALRAQAKRLAKPAKKKKVAID